MITIREFIWPRNQDDPENIEEISQDQQLQLFKYTHESDDDTPSHHLDVAA